MLSDYYTPSDEQHHRELGFIALSMIGIGGVLYYFESWSFNTPCKSLKGILVLFEEEKPYARDTGKFYNPKIQKVSVIVEGKPNQLYAQGMRSSEQYYETCKFLLKGCREITTLMRSKNNYNFTI